MQLIETLDHLVEMTVKDTRNCEIKSVVDTIVSDDKNIELDQVHDAKLENMDSFCFQTLENPSKLR